MTHLRSLDVLRGAAILIVMLFHLLVSAYGFDHPGYHHQLLANDIVPDSWWFFVPLSFGWLGVALFFVISGYIIHLPQARANAAPNWRDFAMRRFWRIYPAYIPCLLFFTWRHHVSPTSNDFILHLFLIHNVSDATFFGSINSSFWTLAFEIQIYAMYPILMIIRQKYGWRWMLPFTCAVSAAWMFYAYRYADALPADASIWFSPFALWPTWALGTAIAEAHAQGRRLFPSVGPWIYVSATLTAASYAIESVRPLGFYFAAVGMGLVVDALVTTRQRTEPLGYRVLAIMGCCSYSAYLINQPFMNAFARLMRNLGIAEPSAIVLIGMFTAIPLAFAIANMGYQLVELNGVRLGKHIISRNRHDKYSTSGSLQYRT